MNIYYKIPISYYHLYLKKRSIQGNIFTKNKLNLYKNWKRQLVLIALKFKLFPKKKINSNADIIFLGNRKKEFYFDTEKIITSGDNKYDFETRKKMNKYFNCIKDSKYSKKKLEEKMIWPTKKITDEDIFYIYKKLINYYKKDLTKKNISELINSRRKRLPFLNKILINNKEKILTTDAHGDFWRGNLEKAIDKKIWIFDWGQKGYGTILEDLFNYFLIEYFYTGKINKELFIRLIKLYKKEFDISKEELINLINIEKKLNKINRQKKQWNILNNFENEIKNYL
jgi:hypothetical protein